MQTSLNFITTSGEPIELPNDPHGDVKKSLENYIKTCGLVAFKDFFMKVKNGIIENLPDGVSLVQYLAIAREVYETRAGRVERQKNRSKFFAVRNRIKRK
ncbi:hypothetical protein GCM10023149_31060 [Mucilaginibacter gynuensis]|uniref:Uncharacterized protein n=1 Tax=Mucilaginibacter gynuensis TaxID=1302236 RepID=A0ABP8GNK0_9SPHI